MVRKCKVSGVNIDLNVCLYWPDVLAPPLKNGLCTPCRPSIRTRDQTWCLVFYSGSQAEPHTDFIMVIMASGIARGSVRTTTTTTAESCKMAAILQIIDWQRHAALVYCVLLWYWTSTLWSIDTCQNKVSADQYHVTISRAQVNSSSRSSVFLKLTADQVLIFFRLDRELMSD